MTEGRTQIAIAVVEHGGCFLVGQRAEGKSLAGYAEFPGGRVETGESPEQAAVRECLEESGLNVEVAGSYDAQLHDYDHDHVHLHFFACRLVGDGMPTQPFRWVPRQRLLDLQFPEANGELLRVLTASH